MTLVRGALLDTPYGASGGASWSEPTPLRVEEDGALLIRDGVIAERGAAGDLLAAHRGEEVVDCRGGLLLPGFVDTHVHFPQVRAIGGLGMPLLEWLERLALPEEARLASRDYARVIAGEFLDGLARAGTTTALVFGSHFADAVDALFEAAASRRQRITTGLVVSDVQLRQDLLTTPDRALAEGAALADRWHGAGGGRLRYAVTPRFAFSCSPELLDSCADLLAHCPTSYVTSHVNENDAEIAGVAQLHPSAPDYVGVYERHGLLGPRSVLAHDVHPLPRELGTLAATRTAVAHCPTSNAALGSGLFPFRAHAQAGVRIALGCDVGAGAGFSLFKEGLQAYYAQQLLGPAGRELTAPDLLRLATAAGADALGLGETVGDLSVGKAFDALWLRPVAGSTLEIALRHAGSAERALAVTFALATPADVAAVWVGGDRIAG